MKKLLILTLCFMALVMGGCKKKNNQEMVQSTPVPNNMTIVENGAIGKTEANGKVKISMPNSVFGENAKEKAESIKQKRGFEAVDVQEDGSVVFTMTKKQHEDWLDDTEDSIEKSAQEVIKGFRSLKEVDFNDDHTRAEIEADKNMYKSEIERVAAEGVANSMFLYQSMNGVKKEDLKAVVTFVDDETDEVLETVEVSGNK